MNIALKYTKIDFSLTKKQNYIMVLFAVISILLFLERDNGFFSIAYMSFAAIVLSTTPFNIENNSDSGFLNMLPSRTSQKVLGRYFYSLSLCIIAFIVEVIEVFIGTKILSLGGSNMMAMVVMMLSLTIIICSFQNVVFYLLGKKNNRQLMSLISILPAFVFMFGGSSLIDFIEDNIEKFSKMVDYFYNNINILSGMSFLISMIVFICCVCISSFIVKKRGIL